MKTLRGVGTPLRRVGTVAALAALGLAAGCSGNQSADTQAGARDVVSVAVSKPYLGDAVRVLTLEGDLRANQEATLFATSSGRIVERPVDLGDPVRAGQVIAVVDHSQLDPAVDQARAALAASQAQAANLATELTRIEQLYRAGGASQQQFDAARTQKAAADEAVRQARAMLDQATVRRSDAAVRAPFAGVVGKLMLEVGDMAGPGAPVAVIVAPKPLIGAVRVPERDLGMVRIGQSVTVTVASYPGVAFKGTVRRISPMIDTATRMAEVEILLPNNDLRLKSGMFASVSIELDRRRGALMLPSDAVLQESRMSEQNALDEVQRAYHVFVKQGSTASRREVTLGYVTGQRVEIRSGIGAQDSIIVEGQHLLQDGQRIEVKASGARPS